MRNSCRFFAVTLALLLALIPNSWANNANKAQTEKWLLDHIEAWDDRNAPDVRVNDCVIQVTTTNNSRILNAGGLLLPVEILSLSNNQDATVRARVREPKSANYAMSRECNAQNDWCKRPSGKFNPERFIDFHITFYRPYNTTERSLTGNKAESLSNAITHYARLCDSNFRADEERIGF